MDNEDETTVDLKGYWLLVRWENFFPKENEPETNTKAALTR